MTAINRVVAEAKKGASEVCIRETEVRTMAEHARLTQFRDLPIDEIADAIRAGSMKIMGAKVVVANPS